MSKSVDTATFSPTFKKQTIQNTLEMVLEYKKNQLIQPYYSRMLSFLRKESRLTRNIDKVNLTEIAKIQ